MAYPKINTSYAQSRYNVTPCANRRTNKTIRYIVIHYTGTTATAQNNCRYFSGGNRNASADYFINKDGSIYKFNRNLAKYYSWHCGDGAGRYGISNYNSVGIEVVSGGNEFTKAQKEALRKLVRGLMEDFNVPASRVVRHYDASRKICPKPYAGSTSKNKKWKELHKYITAQTIAPKNAPFTVRPTKNLVIRTDAGVTYKAVKENKKTLYATKGTVFTITKTKKSKTGKLWGYLKSGKGWIYLPYTEKVVKKNGEWIKA